jgi:single-strand DNA-binding protein
MTGFNKVMLMGHLTRDPQIKYLPNQSAITEFGLACNRHFKTAQGEEKEETLFVDCTAFGKPGETIHKWCQKGKPLFIEGRLKHDTWTDKTTGGKRSKISIVVESFQFLNVPTIPSGTPEKTEQSGKLAEPQGSLAFAEADIPF